MRSDSSSRADTAYHQALELARRIEEILDSESTERARTAGVRARMAKALAGSLVEELTLLREAG
jgi:hypothetical protein